MRLVRTAALAAALATIVPSGARGQFSQYTQPGTTARGGATVGQEELDRGIEEARWRLGPVRVDPWIGLRDLSWNANPAGAAEGERQEGDVSTTAGAGLRTYLPVGPSVVWSAHALPEYVWYADQDDRRRLNGRYGAGVFGFFNRLTLQALGRRTEALEILSAEAPRQANSRDDVLSAAAEVSLGFSLSVFGEAATSRTRNLLNQEERETGPPLHHLDRDEERLRAGIRYRPRDRWTFGVGMEWTETELLSEERKLSSSGEAPLVEVTYSGPKFSASAQAERRTLEPEGDSLFPETETTTYELRLGLEGNRLSPTLYARRSLSLAISQGFSHFETELVGLSASLALGHRTGLRAFAETGRSDFTAIAAGAPQRRDDLVAYGAELAFTLGRSLRLHLGGHRVEFDSNLPGEDRSVTVLRTGVSLGLSGEGAPGWP